MFRSIVTSAAVHGLMVMIIAVFSFISPPEEPRKVVKFDMRTKFIPPGPNQQGRFRPLKPDETLAPAAKPAATPKPAGTPKPVATAAPAEAKPIVKKVASASAGKKKIVKEYTVLDKEPTPEPTPKDGEGDKKEGKDKESKEGEKGAAATPAPSIDTSALATDPGKKQVKLEELSWGTQTEGPTGGGGGSAADLGIGYAQIALFRIQQNFRPPYEMPGVTCVVQFRVQKDGKVSDMKILTTSGRPDLDQSALKAIELTGSLAPLYDDYTKPFVTAEVTFEFVKQ